MRKLDALGWWAESSSSSSSIAPGGDLLLLRRQRPSLVQTAAGDSDVALSTLLACRHAARVAKSSAFLQSDPFAAPPAITDGLHKQRCGLQAARRAPALESSSPASFNGRGKNRGQEEGDSSTAPDDEQPKKKRGLKAYFKEKFSRKKKTEPEVTSGQEGEPGTEVDDNDEAEAQDEEKPTLEQVLSELKALRQEIKEMHGEGSEGGNYEEDPHIFIHMTPSPGGYPFMPSPSPMMAMPQMVAMPRFAPTYMPM